jgi:hypothetical protein
LKTKNIALWSFFAVLLVLPFITIYFRGGGHELVSERPNYIPITEILPVHERKIQDRIELLRGQTLEKTFGELSESQQYHYPGYNPSGDLVPTDIERLLSARSFLKVLQQFGELPRQQAVEKIHVFSEKAIEEFNKALEISLWQNANPSVEHPSPISLLAAKYMVCASMLLAARIGEHELLLNLMDKMQPLIDSYVDRMKAYKPPGTEEILRKIATLEDDAILTVLMHAMKQAGKDTSIPFEGNIRQKTIPLCRWDAPLTHYDFEVLRGLRRIDPNDVIEKFIVYEFPQDLFISDPDGQKKKTISTLRERLSE